MTLSIVKSSCYPQTSGLYVIYINLKHIERDYCDLNTMSQAA